MRYEKISVGKTVAQVEKTKTRGFTLFGISVKICFLTFSEFTYKVVAKWDFNKINGLKKPHIHIKLIIRYNFGTKSNLL